MNFRELVDRRRRKGRPDYLRPRTMAWAARTAGVSYAQLYNLINGTQVAPSWTVAKIARGFKLPPKVVEAALAQSRDEAEVTS